MVIFESLQAAQAAQESGQVFTNIHRVSDTVWEATEPGDPPEPEPTDE